ncbi:MAG: hypothetical protein ABSC55_14400 [Syntrophorhabdales bacterium]
MNKRLLSLFILTVFLTCTYASEGYATREGAAIGPLAGQAGGDSTEGTLLGAAGGALAGPGTQNAVDPSQTQQKLAQQQQSPPYAPAPRPQEASSGEWVEVPGQWVNGTWVAPHKAWVPANSSRPAAGPGGPNVQYPPPSAPGGPPPGYGEGGPNAQYGPPPPGYGEGGPDAQYGAPPPYAISAPPEVAPIPGTYVYFVPGIGVDILFYHGYWYRPYGGRWYRAPSYGGPWVYLSPRRVPHVLMTLPPGYRRLPPGYHPIPHAELQRNWQRWERERHWEHR